jgi:hypothetical protein
MIQAPGRFNFVGFKLGTSKLAYWCLRCGQLNDTYHKDAQHSYNHHNSSVIQSHYAVNRIFNAMLSVYGIADCRTF